MQVGSASSKAARNQLSGYVGGLRLTEGCRRPKLGTAARDAYAGQLGRS